MRDVEKRDRGLLRVSVEECKGCGLCVEACPPKVIGMSERLNHYGYRTATYAGAGCTGCGICFMVCPEPGAITVLLAVNRPAGVGHGAGREFDAGMVGASECTSN
jgi:NAD-dependent dihydropyrimidine dehydrogenase PreA subunit